MTNVLYPDYSVWTNEGDGPIVMRSWDTKEAAIEQAKGLHKSGAVVWVTRDGASGSKIIWTPKS